MISPCFGMSETLRRRKKRSKNNKGAQIGKLKRALIIAAYEGRCWICGAKPDLLSLDHVIPRVDGGGLEVENLRPACPRCNGKRDRRLRAMAGRGRRDAISRELADTWHRAYPLPQFDSNGKVIWLDSTLAASLSPDLLARCFPRRPDLQAVSAQERLVPA
jgi:HNH endonuclease